MLGSASHLEHVLSLVSIVHKNLEHQADWSELRIHSNPNLPRPLISGVPPETIYIDREWVLPVDLREKWTVRQWAEVFDSIPAEPPVPRSAGDGPDDEPGEKRKKRLVMGIVSDDSTVVYYIVHDGIVKPRQN
ncbi:tRNA-splicing endonuclease subunit Sen15 [Tirmania nivea]|nr:tRNA-splicing endonuclease subunit Sen15 [Tirmania nivea]